MPTLRKEPCPGAPISVAKITRMRDLHGGRTSSDSWHLFYIGVKLFFGKTELS
jgi:hypothetical protein